MYSLVRPLFYKIDPESAHSLILQLMRMGSFQPMNNLLRGLYSAPQIPVKAFGLTFKNPVGLAAGYDKDGEAVCGLSALGFGHIEVGTVTPRPQSGNPKPRIFRLVEDEAFINRMGFPGKGMDYVARRLLRDGSRYASHSTRSFRNETVIGINLGKNKDTPLEGAGSDYLALMKTLAPLVDYLVINVSSPNTVGLRRLQGRELLETLLKRLNIERSRMKIRTPVLVKLAPDLADDELEDAIGVILDTGMDGVIATNTTLAREGLRSRYRYETGGLSGSPLKARSEAMLEKIVRQVNEQVPLISVGGIMTPEDAKRRLDRGATLVQVYTGLVYRGPGLVREILRALASAS